jgi:hypothetical protein
MLTWVLQQLWVYHKHNENRISFLQYLLLGVKAHPSRLSRNNEQAVFPAADDVSFSQCLKISTLPLSLRMLVLQVTAVSKEAMVVGMTREAKEAMVADSKVSSLTACVLHMRLFRKYRPKDGLLHQCFMQVTEAPMLCITSSISMIQCQVMPPGVGQELTNLMWPHIMLTYVGR